MAIFRHKKRLGSFHFRSNILLDYYNVRFPLNIKLFSQHGIDLLLIILISNDLYIFVCNYNMIWKYIFVIYFICI